MVALGWFWGLHTYIHTHTYTHIHIHTSTHTYTHTLRSLMFAGEWNIYLRLFPSRICYVGEVWPTWNIDICTYFYKIVIILMHICWQNSRQAEVADLRFYDGVGTVGRMLEKIGLSCKRALQKRPILCTRDLCF